ncbi:TPA: type 1 fimbria D-mannose specific adhesin FimH [Escherichia albertii]|nr:type 1 fimbrin D-mannose specific adhesin FimH [Escherichia albertii]
MKLIWKLILVVTCLWLTCPAWGTVCENYDGAPTDVYYDLSNVFNSTNNQPGQIVVLPEKSGWVGVTAICPVGTLVDYTFRSYVTNFTVQETIDNYQYLKLNDYLLGAMSLDDSIMNTQYPPKNYIQMGRYENVKNHLPFGVMDSHLIFRLKVIRPFINMVEIPRQVMFTVYVTTTPFDPLITPVYTISFSGTVEVPQNCELNTGQIVEFDFGDIGASLFSEAGPGNRPDGVMPQTKSIAIKCTNVAAEAYLTMRLEAETVSGQEMVSDNPDLGFIIADQNNMPLTPNDLNSIIPFRLDTQAAASVTIHAWPVSITGLKPTEGPFSARGYLRVDYQ